MTALTWLDASPTRYGVAAWSVFGLVGALALATFFSRREHGGWRHPVVFLGLTLLALLAFRWPAIYDNRQLADPDESQLIAGALTLRRDPMFWRSVDGTTHGPLAQWPLLLPAAFGAPLDFATARFVSVVLAWLSIGSAWAVFRHWFGVRFAGLLVLPLFAMHAFSLTWYFAAYCSEHAPAALLALGCASLLTAWKEPGGPLNRVRLFGAGFALGAVPFAKLQAAPIAAGALAGGSVLVLALRSMGWRERLRGCALLASGATIIPAIVIGMVLAGGIWAEFWQCYIENNLLYAGGRWFTWAETPAKLIELSKLSDGFAPFFFWIAGFAGLALGLLPRMERPHRVCLIFAVGVLVLAAYATMAPGRLFMHYVQLMIFPIGLAGGLAAGAAGRATSHAPSRMLSRVGPVLVLTLFLGCGLLPQIFVGARHGHAHAGRFIATRGELVRSAVAQKILQHARPPERMGMWGWMPTFWVQTGLIQGTRDGNDSRQIEASPQRDYYRARFLADLKRNRPHVFIDAVGGDNFMYQDRAALAHETVPELRDYIAAHYRLLDDIEGTRIYLRQAGP